MTESAEDRWRLGRRLGIAVLVSAAMLAVILLGLALQTGPAARMDGQPGTGADGVPASVETE